MYINVRKLKTLNLPVGDGTKHNFYDFYGYFVRIGFLTVLPQKGQNPTEDSVDITHGTGSCGYVQLQSD